MFDCLREVKLGIHYTTTGISKQVISMIMRVSEKRESSNVMWICRKLSFATSSHQYILLKLCTKLFKTSNNKSHMLTFVKSTLAEKNSAKK